MNRILFELGSIKIYWYSVIMLAAILVGIYFCNKESRRRGIEAYISDLLFKLIVFGIIGARAYYVVFNFSLYKNDLLSILKIWEGGLAIYGAIIAGIITIIIQARKYEKPILTTTDIIVPSLILGQAIGRWGNFFNGEAHGPVTTLEKLQSLYIPKFIIEGMKIEDIYYEPTFYYESLWCLLGFIILLIIKKIVKNKNGILTFTYFIWYGLGRFFIESLRTDSLYIGEYKVSQLVSLSLIIIGIIGIITKLITKPKQGV